MGDNSGFWASMAIVGGALFVGLAAAAAGVEVGELELEGATPKKPRATDEEVTALAAAMDDEWSSRAVDLADNFFSHRAMTIAQLNTLLNSCGCYSKDCLKIVRKAALHEAIVDPHMGFQLEVGPMYHSDHRRAKEVVSMAA